MSKRRFRLPSPGLVISLVTLSLVLGGTAFAATTATHKDAKADTKLVKKLAPSLSVKHATTAGSATNATSADSATNATHATSADSATHATSADSATHATSADSATHATSADSATNATNATNAITAGNSNNLGGEPPSAYMPNSAVQRGTFFLSQGTTGRVLFSNGPLSVTADCTLSGGVTSVHVNVVSTVANWLDFSTHHATAGTFGNDDVSDGASVGNFAGGTDRIDVTASDGHAMRGLDAFGVNWPDVGQCYVSAWVVTS